MGYVLSIFACKKKGHKAYTFENSMSSFSSQSVIESSYRMALVDAIIGNMQCV